MGDHKLLLPMGGSGTPSNTLFLGPIQAHNPHGIWIVSAVFAQMTAECLCTSQWNALFPSTLPLPIDSDLIHSSLGSPKSSIDLLFALWTRVVPRKHKLNRIRQVALDRFGRFWTTVYKTVHPVL